MYKLTEKEFNIKEKITPKALRELKELGLYDNKLTPETEVETIMGLFTDTEKFKKLANVIFIIDEEIDYDAVSLEEFLKGYQSFFVKWTSSFEKPTP